MEPGFYSQFYEFEKKHWLMRARRKIFSDVLKKNTEQPSQVKLLDFGCASGYFVEQLASAGYQAVGLDSSALAIEIGRSDGNQNIAMIPGKHIDYPDDYFDVALLLDVVEHLEDESWALKEVERVVKPGGIVVISVPAYMFLWGVMDEVSHHYRRYTSSRLFNVVSQFTELKIVRKTYFNTFLFPAIAVVKLLRRWFGIRDGATDFNLANPVLDRVFSAAIGFERFLLRFANFPFGASILTVFKKPK